MQWAVGVLAEAVDKPLYVDSADAGVLEAGLEAGNGRASMINSTKAERRVLEAVVLLARRYDAALVALAMDETGIPKTVEGRLAACRRIADSCRSQAVPLEKIYFDALVIPVSTDGQQGRITLDTLSAVKAEFPGAKTVLPSQAHAKLSMRLVPDQDPERIADLVAAHLKALAPDAVEVEIRSLHGGEPAIVDRDSPWMEAAKAAYADGFGKEPVLVRRGGSIPVVAKLQSILGIETILMGFGLPDDRLHSPNEKFHLPNFYRGIETSIHFMNNLGRLSG
jgi:acetylornithine deacetylase/succinyl-diaminopimelate desuccinylase-like protein